MELFNNTECSKVQANHPLIALHFYSQFIFISSLFRSIYFHLAFPLLCPFSFARLRVTLWLRVLFGLFYCFSQLYVHSLLPGSVFLSGFRRILDLFTVFLCFMSIFSCPIPYFSLASGEFWTFFLFFSALCPFSPAWFRVTLWLHVLFGLFYCFSVLYVHFLLPGSVFLSGFRMFLDIFTVFLSFMSIFSCPVPYFLLVSGCFWTFLLLFCALCPFSPARFRISLWLPENFGLFSCFSRLYVHFLLPGSVLLSGFMFFLDFFTAFLCFMSIFSCPVPYFSLASGCFWTFLLFFSALCPFSPARFRISFWFPDVFGLFYCFSQLYVHFLNSIYSSFRISFWLPENFGLFYCFSCPYVHFYLLGSVFPFWLPENFGLFSWFSRLYIHMEEYRSLKTAMNSEGSGLQRVRKSQDCDEFGCLRTSMSSEGSRLR